MLRACRIRHLRILGFRSITTACNYDHGAISDGRKAATRPRKPTRGGQNLTDKYIRLEKSLRGKDSFSQEIDELIHPDSDAPKSRRKPPQLFHGFTIPEQPKPPADDECCMSGCAVCVYDLYEESLEVYQEALTKLKTNLAAKNVPEYDWPLNIQNIKSSSSSGTERRKETILSAFEEMERNLELKKRQPDSRAGASS